MRPTAVLLLLLNILTVTHCQNLSVPVPSVLATSNVCWFQPNVSVVVSVVNVTTSDNSTGINETSTVTITNNTLSPILTNNVSQVMQWRDIHCQLTLAPLNGTLAPVWDSGSSSVVFRSPLSLPLTWLPINASSLTVSTTLIALAFYLTAPCQWPNCAIISTAGRNVSGSMVVSVSIVSQYYYQLQFTFITNAGTSVTLSSQYQLPWLSWQFLTVSMPVTLTNNSVITVRTTAGSETLRLVLTNNVTMPAPAAYVLTVGDTSATMNIRDVLVVWNDGWTKAQYDAVFSYIYRRWSLSVPPAAATAPTVTRLNATIALVQWQPSFSPTSSVCYYWLVINSNLPSVRTTIPLFSTLTSYQHWMRMDNYSISYSFAVIPGNLAGASTAGSLSFSTSIYALNTTVITPIDTPMLLPNASSRPSAVQILPDGLQVAFALISTDPVTAIQDVSVFYSTIQGIPWTLYLPTPPLLVNSDGRNYFVLNVPNFQSYQFIVCTSNIAGSTNSTMSPPFAYVNQNPNTPLLSSSSTGVAGIALSSSSAPIDSVSTVTLPPPPPANNPSSSGTGSSVRTSTSTVSTGLSLSSSNSNASSSNVSASSSSLSPTVSNGPTVSLGTSSFNNDSTKYNSSTSTTGSWNTSTGNGRYSSSIPLLTSLSAHSSTTSEMTDSSTANGAATSQSQSLDGNDAVIVGLVIGLSAGAIILGALIYCCFCRKAKPAQSSVRSGKAIQNHALPRAPADPRVYATRSLHHLNDTDIELASIDADWDADDEKQQLDNDSRRSKLRQHVTTVAQP